MHLMSYDSTLNYVGGFGRYQLTMCFLMCLTGMPSSIHIFSTVFTTVEPPFRCAVPGLENDTFHIQNEAHHQLVNSSIPFDQDAGQFIQCKVYSGHWDGKQLTNASIYGFASIDTRKTVSCNRWVYDSHSTSSSLTVDMDLVCDRKSYTDHLNMVVMLGFLIGSLCGGTLADYFGRKKVVIITAVLQGLLGTTSAFIHDVTIFLAIRFLISFLGIALFLTNYVLIAEVVGAKYRTRASIAAFIGWTIGQFYEVLIFYFIKDWRTAQVVISAPFIAVISYCWLIDESPRWLIVRKRTEEATTILRRMAKVNKTQLPECFELAPVIDVDVDSTTTDKGVKQETPPKQLYIWHMCSSRVLLIRMIILVFVWSSLSVVFYGLSFNVGSLIEGDLFVSFSAQVGMELMAVVLCVVCLERAGRKKIFCACLLVGGMACLASAGAIFTKYNWISLALFSIGKFGVTAAFLIIYVMTVELIPTVVRNSGLGLCSSMARVSSLASPYIGVLGHLISEEYGGAFSLVLCGISSVLAGLLGLYLPETRNRKMPETIEDAKNITKIVKVKAFNIETTITSNPAHV